MTLIRRYLAVRTKFIILMVIIGSCAEKYSYTLTAPTRFRTSSQYKFVLSLYGVPRSDYNLSTKIQSNDEIVVEKVFIVKQASLTRIFSLKITPEYLNGEYIFYAEADGNVNFNINQRIFSINKIHSVFIQTDKYFYKPGQTVLYRVIVLSEDLKPLSTPVNVTIYNDAGNRMFQVLDQKDQSGVISSHFKLSDNTQLGRWNIIADAKFYSNQAFFQVVEDVLPKYEVKVNLPSYFFLNEKNPNLQKNLEITVTATYAFGKPVLGYADVRVSISSGWIYAENSIFPYIDKKVELKDRKADVSLTLEQLNNLNPGDGLSRSELGLFVQANVTEAATGIVLQANNTVFTSDQRYQLEFLRITPDCFMPGFNYKAYIQLSQMDYSQPLTSDIKFLNGSSKYIEVKSTANGKVEREVLVPVTSSGYMTFEIPTDSNWESINFDVFFEDSIAGDVVRAQKDISIFYTRDQKYIQLSLVGKATVIRPNEELTFRITTTEKIKEFQYQVLGKGAILTMESYSSDEPTTNATFSIYFSRELAIAAAPEAQIVAFYITSTGELVADCFELSVTDYTANKVSLSFNPTSLAPGDEVMVSVNATAGSHVSLSASDQNVYLLHEGNGITKQVVTYDLNEYIYGTSVKGSLLLDVWPRSVGSSCTGWFLDSANLFIATDAYILGEDDLELEPPGAMPPKKNVFLSVKNPRKTFTDTWIWSDIITGENGSSSIKYVAPDTITSWIVTAFATHEVTGLGITEKTEKVTVTKPFFISLDLPYSIIRGEQFALQATVFNNFGQDLQVNVSLPKSNYYKMKECVNGAEKDVQHGDAFKLIFVPNNDLVTVYFWIVPTSLGQIPIEVKAFAGVAADSHKVNLLVKPGGDQQTYSSSSLIKLPPGHTNEVNFVLTLPPTDILVPDSVIIEATLSGNVVGSAISNLDKLLELPHGCGEQNMVTLAPDVYIRKYLNSTDQITETIKAKALGFIREGYQRQLTYRREDRSFSAFGNLDEEGSVWLSAFVVRVFNDAKDSVPITKYELEQALAWILKQQLLAGAFKESLEAKIVNEAIQGGSRIILTAYVAITLLKSKEIEVENLENQTNLAVSYLENNYKDYSEDPYVLSIISYAFHLAVSPELTNVLKLLDSLATNEGETTHWHMEVPGIHEDPNVWTPPYSRPQSNDVEMTSYVLLTYASQNDLSKSLPIAKWLIKNRNAHGGFTSTQDTVLGLEALAEFGRLVSQSADNQNLSVEVSYDSTSKVHKFKTVTKETSLLVQSVELPHETNAVKFISSGQGIALAQVNVQYNVNSGQKSDLIHQTLLTNGKGTKVELQICLKWTGKEQAGMILVEVNLLSGYILSDGYESSLKNDMGLPFKKLEYRNNALFVYFDEVTSDALCFKIQMESAFYVNNVKPALVKTYQYYSPGVFATGYYSPLTSVSADICNPSLNNDGMKKYI